MNKNKLIQIDQKKGQLLLATVPPSFIFFEEKPKISRKYHLRLYSD